MNNNVILTPCFNINNQNKLVYIHLPDIHHESEYGKPSRLIMRPNSIPMGEFDLVLPEFFTINLIEEWDSHQDIVICNLSGDNVNLTNVIINKLLLYNIVDNQDCFIVVNTKVFYLEDPDMMSYQVDSISYSSE